MVAGMCGPARDSLKPAAVIVEHCPGMISMQHGIHSANVRSNLLAIGEALNPDYMIRGLNGSSFLRFQRMASGHEPKMQ